MTLYEGWFVFYFSGYFGGDVARRYQGDIDSAVL